MTFVPFVGADIGVWGRICSRACVIKTLEHPFFNFYGDLVTVLLTMRCIAT